MARRGDGLYLRGNTWYLDCRLNGARYVVRLGKGITLSANISETLALPEFSVEGGEGIEDGNDGCYAIIHLGGGSDGETDAAAIYSGVQAAGLGGSR